MAKLPVPLILAGRETPVKPPFSGIVRQRKQGRALWQPSGRTPTRQMDGMAGVLYEGPSGAVRRRSTPLTEWRTPVGARAESLEEGAGVLKRGTVNRKVSPVPPRTCLTRRTISAQLVLLQIAPWRTWRMPEFQRETAPDSAAGCLLQEML